MKLLKPKYLLLTTIIGLLLIWFIYAFILSDNNTKNYLTTTVTRKNIENNVLANGVIKPYKLVSVGAQASGQIKVIKVTVGDSVKKGDAIAEIDDLTQRNQLKEAQASLANLQAQRKAKEASLKNLQVNYDRQKKLIEKRVGSQSELDAAETELDVVKAEIVALDANIEKAIINVNTAELNLGYTKISAPMDGVIVAIPVEEGQTVNAVQTAPTIVKIAQLDKMTVEAEISEADIVKIDQDKNDVYFTILGAPDKPFTGLKLKSIKPGPESINNDNYLTATTSSSGEAIYYHGLFDVDNPDNILKPSMSAQVYIVLDKVNDVLTIPSSAIQHQEGNKAIIYKINANNQPEEVEITVGLDNNISVEVISGLNENDEIIDGKFELNKASNASNSMSLKKPRGL